MLNIEEQRQLAVQFVRETWENRRVEMRRHLITKRGFNPRYVDAFISNFIESLVFAAEAASEAEAEKAHRAGEGGRVMPEAVVLYCGQNMRVACDGKCHKAWGRSNRPRVLLSLTDEDDYALKADHELAVAPKDPGTCEGTDAKPPDVSYFPNRWCVRECERAAHSEPGRWQLPLVLPDFSERRYNKPHRTGEGG